MKADDLNGLVQAIARKDREAFGALYQGLEKPLFRFINLRLNDPHRSADVMHEVFLEVWRSADNFQGKSSARTWIFSIAYRRAMDVFRRNGRLQFEGDLPEQIDDETDTEASFLAVEEADAVRACIASLSEEHRVAVELTFFEEMSYQEIASIVGVPEGTVKSRVYHAKQLLLRCLAGRLDRGVKR